MLVWLVWRLHAQNILLQGTTAADFKRVAQAPEHQPPAKGGWATRPAGSRPCAPAWQKQGPGQRSHAHPVCPVICSPN
jgi:hypothetical protein